MKQFLAVLWSQRLAILVAMVSCVLGGSYILATATPRYEAVARVVLEVVKPDPITGAVVGSKQIDAYVSSQARLIGDVQVAARAVENLGWTGDPAFQSEYAERPPADGRSFIEWLGQQVADQTSVSVVQDTNILEIHYRGESPEEAISMVEAIRAAYIEATVSMARESARAEAASLDPQIEAVQTRLTTIEAQKAAMERETGVMISDTGSDLENNTLGALAKNSTMAALSQPKSGVGYTQAEQQLLQLDMAIASAGATMGPNNPAYQALVQRRSIAVQQVAEQRARLGRPADQQTLSSLALSSTMAKITAQRIDVTKLRSIQDEINVRRAEYNQLMERRGNARVLSRVAQANLTPLSGTTVSDTPVTPRPGVILGGTVGIGLVVGGLVAMLAEFLNRRVRSADDLALAVSAPVLLQVPLTGGRRPKRQPRRRAEQAIEAMAPAE